MGSIIDYLFQAPAMPPVPLPAHLASGIVGVLREAYHLVYLRGVYDGFLAGALATMILLPRLKGGDRR